MQKKLPLSNDEEKLLKAKSLIEGRKPNFYISQKVAQKIGKKASYSKNRAFDKQYYLDMVCKAIGEHGSLNRNEIDELLWDKLPDVMNDKQKKSKVGNLITELRKKGLIQNAGTSKQSLWLLLK